MKQLLLSLGGLVTLLFFASSCKVNVLKGEGNKITVSPSVSAFSGVDISLPLTSTIKVVDGSQPGVSVYGYENLVKHIHTKIKDNKLYLYSDLDESWTMDYDGMAVTITMPAINSLSLSGASDADVQGNVSGKEFDMELSGASRAVVDNINADLFSTGISGASNITVNGGNVKVAKYEVSGASKIRAFPLQTLETTASISGASHGEVTATQKLSADVSGAGSMKYKGHPANVNKDVSGAGSMAEVD
jgi:putative autotransporter adhesin-like protein